MTIKIENDHLLTERFGLWPSLHDAEIIHARFERDGDDAPSLECDIQNAILSLNITKADSYGAVDGKERNIIEHDFGLAAPLRSAANPKRFIRGRSGSRIESPRTFS